MTGDRTVEQALTEAIRKAADYNPEVQEAPACVLWPDEDRQWETVIPALQDVMPELLVLGDYAPDRRAGPAIWLRCVLAQTLEDVVLPAGRVPVIYSPGVARRDLRAVDQCPDTLKPLAELQFRGTIWSQVNSKDWTVLAFLKSEQGGLGLDVATDKESRQSMNLALPKLLDQDLELLQGRHLDKDYFNTLLTGGDPTKDLLQWLNQGTDTFRSSRTENEWQAFVQVCRSQLAFDPENQGPLEAAAHLAGRQGPWLAVWERFSEAPHRYRHIPEFIRRCRPPTFDLFADAETAGGWPQWNDQEEDRLARELVGLRNMAPHKARRRLQELEATHAARRDLVWAELGQAPLALALEALAEMAEVTAQSLAAGEVQDMATAYEARGWRADDCLLQALSRVGEGRPFEAVSSAIRAVYAPWAEEAARHLQTQWDPEEDGAFAKERKAAGWKAEGTECVLFVDGLRFDCAKRLQSKLVEAGLEVDELTRWAPLPSVTGTGKYAVAPVLDGSHIGEEPDPGDFTPITRHLFQKLVTQAGWQFLNRESVLNVHREGDPRYNAWAEFGDLDHEGHDRGWKLAQRVDALLEDVQDRIHALLEVGWNRVRVVTDHGWLLLPEGLPKTDLAAGLAESKWGRCAVLKEGAESSVKAFPWYWDPKQHFALAPGISCFKANQEYTHGGLSLPECLNLKFTVTPGAAGTGHATLEFTDVAWQGLRLRVAVDSELIEDFGDMLLDLRQQAGNPQSSIAMSANNLKADGRGSVVVPDEDLHGEEVQIVILDDRGDLMAQKRTLVGGEC